MIICKEESDRERETARDSVNASVYKRNKTKRINSRKRNKKHKPFQIKSFNDPWFKIASAFLSLLLLLFLSTISLVLKFSRATPTHTYNAITSVIYNIRTNLWILQDYSSSSWSSNKNNSTRTTVASSTASSYIRKMDVRNSNSCSDGIQKQKKHKRPRINAKIKQFSIEIYFMWFSALIFFAETFVGECDLIN